MENKEKLTVVWVCGFSNTMIREKLKIRVGWLNKQFRKLIHSTPPVSTTDYGVWNTNAIHEFEKFENVNLHIIAPCPFLARKTQEFDINGIQYHFYRDEETLLITSFYRKLARTSQWPFWATRHIVKSMINRIKPEIIHLIGAENPRYSITLLDVPTIIPTIVQLQTLLNDPAFKSNHPLNDASFIYRSKLERKILSKANYIGCVAKKYTDIILNDINPHAQFVNIRLATGESINLEPTKKEFDFVYFASNISKACDLALEAFGIAYQKNPSITLDIVGEYHKQYKKEMDLIINKYHIENAVVFEGRLKTHEDVISQIRKAKFALLPLRIDIMSNTIREAMANGLPVLTTDTGEFGTQRINKERQNVIISPKGDHYALAENMVRIIKDSVLADKLKQSAVVTIREKYDNSVAMRKWLDTYYDILNKNKTNSLDHD